MRHDDSLTYPDIEDGREDSAVFSMQPDTIPTCTRTNLAILFPVVPHSQIHSKSIKATYGEIKGWGKVSENRLEFALGVL